MVILINLFYYENKFIKNLLRKGVYPYEYIDICEKLDETTLPPEGDFYNELNEEGISDADYAHAQKIWELFELGNRDEYHDLYIQSDTLLLADVFEKLRDKCIEIYGLDPSYFYSAPGLAWQACSKKTDVKLELLTDYQILLMIEEGIRGGMRQSVHRYAKANNKYMKNYDKSIESLYLTYLDANNLYRCLKNYNEDSDVGYFLEVDVEYPKKLWGSHKDLPFLQKRKKIEKVEKLVCSIEESKMRHPHKSFKTSIK